MEKIRTAVVGVGYLGRFHAQKYAALEGSEQGPLMAALAWSTVLTVASSAAFLGEVRRRAWRRPVQLALLCALVGMAWHYWPR